MKTVAHFIDGDAVGGTERVAMQLIAALDRTRWRPVLLHHGGSGIAPLLAEASAAGIETRVVPQVLTAQHWGRMPAFVRAIRALRPSVLHAHLSWPLSCKYGLAASTLAGVPATVATAQLYFDVSKLPLVAAQPRLIAKAVGRYLAVSTGVARQLLDEFGIPQAKVEIVRNGIDVSRYEQARVDAEAQRQTRSPERRNILASRSDQPVVLTVARLEQQKGLPYLIDAVPLVPGVSFAIAGDGPDREALEKQAVANGVGDRVIFLGRRDDVPALLAAADLFVLPSLYEGLPLSIMEAMAAGTPVIASDIGGNNELVVSGTNGLLVPPRNPAALADAVTMLVANPSRAASLAAVAQAQAHREFDFAHSAARVSAIYDELLAGRS